LEELLAYEGDVEEDFGLTFQVVLLHYHFITLPVYSSATRDCRSAVRNGDRVKNFSMGKGTVQAE